MSAILTHITPNLSTILRGPESMLILTAAAMPLSFATWMLLLNNFAIERAQFDGVDMGILQSIREIPGFLSFLFVYLLLVIREQRILYLALALCAFGTAITGMLPTYTGLMITTFIGSVGFHYFETASKSMTMQLCTKERLPIVMGRQVAGRAVGSLIVYAVGWCCFSVWGLSYETVYLMAGGATILIV
ncbi:MAG: MFS transporter, partial [Pseudomonadota bacterium]